MWSPTCASTRCAGSSPRRRVARGNRCIAARNRRRRRGAGRHLARERARLRDWDPGAREEGGSWRAGQARLPAEWSRAERSGARREPRGRCLEVQPRASFKFLGAQRPWLPPGLCLQLRGGGGRGGQRGPRFAIYKFPELPALAPPPAAGEAGRLGRPGLRVPAWQLQRRAEAGVGDKPWVPRCRRCPLGTGGTRASRVGLARLRRGSKGRPGSECWSPGSPGGSGLARGAAVSAELRRLPLPSRCAGGIAGEGGERTP